MAPTADNRRIFRGTSVKLPASIRTRLGNGGVSHNDNSPSRTIVFTIFVLVLMVKVLWGYWDRDLTFGDTSMYFLDAVRWYQAGQVNFVWSPLYTAYYGSWLGITEDAAAATLLHRIGLIIISTILVAWLGLLTLPRLLALLLTIWWIALPIHYDTLYEVHLFGTLPILIMAVIAFRADKTWRMPLLIGVALSTTVLIRNEYSIALVVFITLASINFARQRHQLSIPILRTSGLRYGIVLLAVGVLIAYFYSASHIKGNAIKEASKPKHTLNMCQVYAFGYKQRNPSWTQSPWTECSNLMQEKFGASHPSLLEMTKVNPREVAEHFLWNLSLTPAGLEVLLFNVTSSKHNPDYAPVFFIPVLPRLLLVLSLVVGVAGTILIYRNRPDRFADIRATLGRIAPVLLASVVMALAVILTQRPRPSYLMGVGILYIWLLLVYLSILSTVSKKLDNSRIFWAVAAVLLLVVPSYRSLPLNSKLGTLGKTYAELRSQSASLCVAPGLLAIGEYGTNIANYLCAPHESDPTQAGADIIDFESLPAEAFSRPHSFVTGLEAMGVYAVIIDPYLIQKKPGLNGCHALSYSFQDSGWKQLQYSITEDERCIAAYTRTAGDFCGRKNCRCADDPAARHGPYYEWSRHHDGRLHHSVMTAGRASEALYSRN